MRVHHKSSVNILQDKDGNFSYKVDLKQDSESLKGPISYQNSGRNSLQPITHKSNQHSQSKSLVYSYHRFWDEQSELKNAQKLKSKQNSWCHNAKFSRRDPMRFYSIIHHQNTILQPRYVNYFNSNIARFTKTK